MCSRCTPSVQYIFAREECVRVSAHPSLEGGKISITNRMESTRPDSREIHFVYGQKPTPRPPFMGRVSSEMEGTYLRGLASPCSCVLPCIYWQRNRRHLVERLPCFCRLRSAFCFVRDTVFLALPLPTPSEILSYIWVGRRVWGLSFCPDVSRHFAFTKVGW